MREASGDYLAFLDSDDMWLPEKTELQMAKLKEDAGYAMVHADRLRVGPDGAAQPAKAHPRNISITINSFFMSISWATGPVNASNIRR